VEGAEDEEINETELIGHPKLNHMTTCIGGTTGRKNTVIGDDDAKKALFLEQAKQK
jgi:hypothetical protein